MKLISLKEKVISLPNTQILNLIQEIELRKGRVFDLPKFKNINRLHDLSLRRSTTASNAIEGIKVAPRRETDLLIMNLKPEAYEDYLVLGYNSALKRIFSSYKYQSLDEKFILDLHKLMYEGFNPEFGGKWKDTQNYIVKDNGKENPDILFTPSRPEEVPGLMSSLVWQYNACCQDPDVNRLLLIPVFVFDFLCIHPFNDGNGRISRLLTSFFLLKAGYDVEFYYSLSYLILDRLADYYKALQLSSSGWKVDKNDYSYFTIFLLQIILEGYGRLEEMTEFARLKADSVEKVLTLVEKASSPVSKAEIEEILFSLSRTTIEQSLGSLVKGNKIQIVQSGHYAKYYRK